MGEKLPDLDRRETIAFLNAFTSQWRQGRGSSITGTARDGHPFAFHAAHPLGIRRDFLRRILRDLGVSREEFDEWRSTGG